MNKRQLTHWQPSPATVEHSNIFKAMKFANTENYQDFHQWSCDHKEEFWSYTVEQLGIKQFRKYSQILNLDNGIEQAEWLYGAKLNIAESCFRADGKACAIIYQEQNSDIKKLSYEQLHKLCKRVANGLKENSILPGDTIAIDMPMTVEAVAIYLGAILYGAVVVTVADSFAPEEIRIRLEIAEVKLVFTQDIISRSGKKFSLYEKIKTAGNWPCIVITTQEHFNLLNNDQLWDNFLSSSTAFNPYISSPQAAITILFSSGTTGSPKAIPWNHTTPIKSAADAYYHHDIHPGDVVCWPTNLGWMMGPWLVFASLINKGTIALYYDSPLTPDFGQFVENAKVNMLGLVPSLVSGWRGTSSIEKFNWQNINCFSSTGECSNPDDMNWLMNLIDGGRPVIEYCGGTETGGGYITSTIVQENIPSQFSTAALGGNFVILNELSQQSDEGEAYLIPPILGLSIKLLNRDHHQVYYENCPKWKNTLLRQHGDRIQQLDNKYFRAQGRNDDSMNLGGIKVSSTQIEELINQLSFIQESAAIAVPPSEGGPSQLVIYFVSHGEIPNNALNKMKKIIRHELNPLFKVHDCTELNTLPRTASNKVMRRKLRELYRQENL